MAERHRKTRIKYCKHCEKVFETKKAKTVFCSISCGSSYPHRNRRGADYSQITIKDLREKYSVYQMHAKIRGLARDAFRRSEKPLECVCGYSLHVDICHIRPVSDFPDETPISEVNDLNNLIALDKRCHWEFDNGHLEL